MDKLLGFEDLPEEIVNQIHEVVNIWKMHLGEELVGVYLH